MFTENNSKWIKKLILRCKVTKLLEENIGQNCIILGLMNNK